MFALCKASDTPVYNAVAPEPVQHLRFASEVGKRTFTLIRAGVPAGVARLLAGEMAEELLLGGQRVLPEQLASEGFSFRFPTLADALDDLL